MMRHKTKILLLLAMLTIVAFYACSKYKDPPKVGPDDRLTNPYCNDSRGINYNWDFPGIPDNSICIYPVDSFLGTWLFTDSIFRPDGDTIGVQVKTLNFTATEDTLKTHIAVQGWCSGNTPFYITANKYSSAHVDSLFENIAGQLLCATMTDTITGVINLNQDSLLPKGEMIINFTISNTEGTTYHRGRATKQ